MNPKSGFFAKRRAAATALILIAVPALLFLSAYFALGRFYLPLSLLLLFLVTAPFFMVFENRRPRAREVLLIAVLSALIVSAHLAFHLILPVPVGTSLVILSGVCLGPEAGFLVGALSRLLCNAFLGQGMWTPWQMFSWGLLGFLSGYAFSQDDKSSVSHSVTASDAGGLFRSVSGPLFTMLFSALVAYVSVLIFPGKDPGFPFWRLYAFGAAGILLGLVLRRRRMSARRETLTIFAFFVTFVLYGGIMNFAGMLTGSGAPGSEGVSLSALRALYVSGAPYDLLHACTAAAGVFFLTDPVTSKLARIKIKYGIYK